MEPKIENAPQVISEQEILKLAEDFSSGKIDVKKVVSKLREMKGKKTDQEADAIFSFAMELKDQYKNGDDMMALSQIAQIISEIL